MLGVIIAALIAVLVIVKATSGRREKAAGEQTAAEISQQAAGEQTAGEISGEVTPEEVPQEEAAEEQDPAGGAGEAGITALQAETQAEPVSFTISAAGDCTLGSDVNFPYGSSFWEKYDEVQDPSYFFRNVYDIFADDDLTIVNLEGTITEETKRQDKAFAFRADPEYAQILAESSIEAANLANNHSHDYGEKSYTDTISYVEEAGVPTFGYERTLVLDVKGVKVGLTGTYELAEGIDCKDDLLAAIQDVKDQGAEVIISTFHWGIERDHYPNNTQVELAHAAIDAGADLVLGHHPHVLQGIERYHGKNIVYSLANFCFGGNFNPNDKDTMIYRQTFTVDNGEVIVDDEHEVIPCRVSSVPEKNNYQPTPFEGDDAQRVLDRIEEYSRDLSTEPDPV